ncbi:MAG: hypothetical protein R3296_06945 [Oleiphilaceae bacterium]|nr:hypothetical protein [Oleiphilaceae bacterium]
MLHKSLVPAGLSLLMLMGAVGCSTQNEQATPEADALSTTSQSQSESGPFAKPGFRVSLEDSRLWVLRGDQEKSEKHATLIGAGPQGMTVKAPDRETALAYLTQKPGFKVEIEDGRLWVLRDGQEKSEKHATLIGAGPMGMTVKALDRETALAYLAAREGFRTDIEDGRLWVLKGDQEKSEKHATLIGAGPQDMTIKALDRETVLEYLGSKPGFRVTLEDNRLWVLRPGQKMSEKHVTLIGEGPQGVSLKALDMDTLQAYQGTTVY